MKPEIAPARSLDLTLLALTLGLVGVGLIMVYSSSTVLAMNAFGDFYYFVKRQLVWTAVGLGGLAFFAGLPYERLRALARPALIAGVVLLLAVLALSFGRSAGGARRWLSLGPLSFQPSEWVKVALVLYLAEVMSRKGSWMKEFVPGLVPQLLVIGVVGGLLLLQPDLGTTVILALVGFGMLFAAGARPAHLSALVLAALPAAALLVLSVGYRRRRLLAFWDPWSEPLGRGFQMIQSYLALGSGGLWGKGLCGSQQKLFYLPTPHTDFIFSILGEELGFAGTFLFVILFGWLLMRGFAIASRCADRFGKLLALGLTLLLGTQLFVNLGVVTGLVPTKGTPLPFISAGGSSLLFSLAAVGILLSIARHGNQERP